MDHSGSSSSDGEGGGSEGGDNDQIHRGVSRLWSKVNHIAIVVRDIGRSLHFYTDVVGMQQVLRPDFDR